MPLNVYARIARHWLRDELPHMDQDQLEEGWYPLNVHMADCHTTRAAIWEICDKEAFQRKHHTLHPDKVCHLFSVLLDMWH